MANLFHSAIPAEQLRGQILSACVHGVVNAVALPQFSGVKSAAEARASIVAKPWETVLEIFQYSPNYSDSFELAARNEAARAYREMRLVK